MLKFFRKIRQQKLSENHFSKYLLYALGEVLLVVIGILMALQINNWSEDRKEFAQELEITAELYAELDRNLTYTKGAIKDVEERIQALKDLFALTAAEKPSISYDKFNYLYAKSSSYQEYTPISNKVRKILELEEFEFSKSRVLYDELLGYSSNLQSVEEYYQLIVDTWKMVNQPFIVQEYPLRNFYWIPEELRKSKHSIDHLALLNNRKFESLLAAMYADVDGYHQRLLANIEKIKSLKQVIKKDYAEIFQKNKTTAITRRQLSKISPIRHRRNCLSHDRHPLSTSSKQLE